MKLLNLKLNNQNGKLRWEIDKMIMIKLILFLFGDTDVIKMMEIFLN